MKLLKLLIGFLISFLCLYLLFSKIDLDAFLSSLKNLEIKTVGLCFIVAIFIIFLRTQRWLLIINAMSNSHSINFLKAFHLLNISYFLNYIFPARAGDVFRGIILNKDQISKKDGLISILTERMYDFISIILFFDLFFFYGSYQSLILPSIFVKLVWIANGIFLSLLISYFLIPIPHKIKKIFLVLNTKQIFKVLSISMIIWCIESVIPYILFNNFNFNLNFSVAVLMILSLVLGSMIPAAPGLIGVFQVACVYVLKFYDIEQEPALAFSIAWNLILYAKTVLFGIGGITSLGLEWSKLKKSIQT